MCKIIGTNYSGIDQDIILGKNVANTGKGPLGKEKAIIEARIHEGSEIIYEGMDGNWHVNEITEKNLIFSDLTDPSYLYKADVVTKDDKDGITLDKALLKKDGIYNHKISFVEDDVLSIGYIRHGFANVQDIVLGKEIANTGKGEAGKAEARLQAKQNEGSEIVYEGKDGNWHANEVKEKFIGHDVKHETYYDSDGEPYTITHINDLPPEYYELSKLDKEKIKLDVDKMKKIGINSAEISYEEEQAGVVKLNIIGKFGL